MKLSVFGLMVFLTAGQASPTSELREADRPVLRQWYDALEAPRTDETFGQLVRRAALHPVGRPYAAAKKRAFRPVERFEVRLDAFVCSTYVRHTLALARCLWLDDDTEDCFVREARRLRYRGGWVSYESRLRYFTDWLDHQAHLGRVLPLSAELGGISIRRRFFEITRHPKRFPAMSSAQHRHTVSVEEDRLSRQNHVFLETSQLPEIEDQLRDGDIFAVVSSKPGLLVRHVGFVGISEDGQTQVLHATSRGRSVRLEPLGLADYALLRQDAIGVMIARPVAPDAPLSSI